MISKLIRIKNPTLLLKPYSSQNINKMSRAVKNSLKQLEKLSHSLENTDFDLKNIQLYDSENQKNELTYISNFCLYAKLIQNESLKPYLEGQNLVDYKNKLAGLLLKKGFLQNLNSRINFDATIIVKTIQSIHFDDKHPSEEDRIIMRTLTGIIFEKWDPEIDIHLD